MTPSSQTLAQMTRPKLLVSAAQIGLKDYKRDQDLKKVLRERAVPPQGKAAALIAEIEREMDTRRRTQDPTYSPVRHLEALIALIAEVEASELVRAA